jgi:pilus assembly protein CpaF
MREIPKSWQHLDCATNYSSILNPVDKKLLPALQFILDEVRREILSLNRNTSLSNLPEAELQQLIKTVAYRSGFDLTPNEQDELISLLDSDFKAFGPLQSLVDDVEVTDIIVRNFADITVQRGRQNFKTGAKFACEKTYEAFVERLLQRAGTSYSTKQPIADGMIDSYARIHAVNKCLCDNGPYLTIRINRFERVNPDDLVKKGMLPKEIVEYLREAMRVGLTVMVVGEVGTGKTTLTRAIAAMIPLPESILVIEDTPEIKLTHPFVRYLTTREENSEGEGKIPPSRCIRASMRMAMNRIVFGEIRDAEAAEAFIDVCASGHPGVSTIHGRSINDCLTRLELFLGRAQPNVGKDILMKQIAGSINILIYVNVCPETKKRRLLELKELAGVNDGIITTRTIFSYLPSGGEPRWEVRSRASTFRELGFNFQLNSISNQLFVE